MVLLFAHFLMRACTLNRRAVHSTLYSYECIECDT